MLYGSEPHDDFHEGTLISDAGPLSRYCGCCRCSTPPARRGGSFLNRSVAFGRVYYAIENPL